MEVFDNVAVSNLKLWSDSVKSTTRKYENIEDLVDYETVRVDRFETQIEELQSHAAELRSMATKLAVRIEASPDPKCFTSLVRQ